MLSILAEGNLRQDQGAASWAQSTREEHHLHEMAVGQVEKRGGLDPLDEEWVKLPQMNSRELADRHHNCHRTRLREHSYDLWCNVGDAHEQRFPMECLINVIILTILPHVMTSWISRRGIIFPRFLCSKCSS